jgi:transglutaminase-like putative cysteine protease
MPFILAALGIAAAPHYLRLPAWVALASIVLGLYALAAALGRAPWPGRIWRLGMTGLVVGLVAAAWGLAFDREAAVAVFLLMASLKPLEIRTPRDRMVTLSMGYLVILTALFSSDHLLMGLYLVGAVGVLTAAMIRIQGSGGLWSGDLRLAARLTLQALPIMAILFLLFPRFQGSLWGFGRETVARTGFSEELTLGEISRLVPDTRIAFRAEFETPVPPPGQRYWRGVVLWNFDGRSWRRGVGPAAAGGPVRGAGESRYTIALEPHGQHWLMALDLPSGAPPGALLTEDRVLRVPRPVSVAMRYTLVSVTLPEPGPVGRRASAALAVDPDTNPRSAALARRWASDGAPAAAIVRRALDFFATQGFVYSLAAPPLLERPLDTFLFETRRGYCEHYASALAFLLRVAGVPARVVLGYHGGEVNPFGGYLVVRQSEAHAWVEAWIPQQGWTRIDPTGVVAPARLTEGVVRALPQGELGDDSGLALWGPLAGLARRAGYGWDAIHAGWQRWVAGYSFQRQQGLLGRLGLSVASAAGVLGVTLVAVAALSLLVWAYLHLPARRPRQAPDEVQRLYRRFAAALARVGVVRPPHEGPWAFAARAVAGRPDLGPEIERITALYVRLRYEPGGTAADLAELRRRVRTFRPSRRPGRRLGSNDPPPALQVG